MVLYNLIRRLTIAAQKEHERYIYIPTTISQPAQLFLKVLQNQPPWKRQLPAPNDLPAWRKIHDQQEAIRQEANQQSIEKNEVIVIETKMNDVPVLDIRPKGWQDNGKLLVYSHGGAYTLYSARTTLTSVVPVSRASGLRIISVDYTTAPFAKWNEIQQQMISVFKALQADGYKMNNIGVFGDSAGGALITSTVLNLRDHGLGMPVAVVLWSPWVDLTNEGDTAYTLKDADPILNYSNLLENSALAFANGLDLKDPRVSPIYADFSKGFPPTLIQESTKTILLSTSTRLYQKLDAAGQRPIFDIYEGLPHVFQSGSLPESEIAIKKTAAFFKQYLQ